MSKCRWLAVGFSVVMLFVFVGCDDTTGTESTFSLPGTWDLYKIESNFLGLPIELQEGDEGFEANQIIFTSTTVSGWDQNDELAQMEYTFQNPTLTIGTGENAQEATVTVISNGEMMIEAEENGISVKYYYRKR